ncbi:hypothetical protein PIB30_014278 [Stylosanthes scabra]|uniref:Phytosulfokine n=1 Tax=Stylosanthes scabra TaxID=79078 RepID=A0ABU6Z382_9FABA|nr:hypothetical protein [Stylosanthes scabra]
MSNKFATFFITLVLLHSFISLIHASRPNFASLNNGFSSLTKDDIMGTKEATIMEALEDEKSNCVEEGSSEECLMRRTLAAHTDYIYTQKHNPKP